MADKETGESVRDKVPAAVRTVAILKLLASQPSPCSLREIASDLNLIPSTCLHILRVLVSEGLVSFNEKTKRYRLAGGILALARDMLIRDPMIRILEQTTERVSERFNVSAIAVRVEGSRCTTVAVSIPSKVFAISAAVGNRYPVYMSATGRCYGAFSGRKKEVIARDLANGQWAQVPDRAQWLKEVEEAKAHGFAVDKGNYIAGVTVIAAPVFNNAGELTHTIGVVSISETAETIGIATLGTELVAAAGEAQQVAGH